ncbi:MAG: 4-(cytidine 5'-diphospho)-2-C-methyl-D-erythritol kinase [Candidatus Omnitrophica bacterium]|nr:4-(cytidine 5'-diphospho)-2-C-methyl-D-erythritol kinase [Candidatus Omnitrophota bacterium]
MFDTRILTLDSFAKLNLSLSVLRKRPDGYHCLNSLFERISLVDKITLISREDSFVTVKVNNTEVPTDKTNLAYQSALFLKQLYKIDKGIDICIEKNIPVASGMGGGSSNAATVLIGLNKMWRLNLTLQQLIKIGSHIGADVPFFIYGCRFAWVKGKGQIVIPLAELNRIRLWHVILVIAKKKSTAEIYAAWDKFPSLRLTKKRTNAKLICLALKNKNISALTKEISNSLEPVAEILYPQLKEAKSKLLAAGAKTVLMSGSGLAVYGIFTLRKEAERVFNRLHNSFRNKVFFAYSI